MWKATVGVAQPPSSPTPSFLSSSATADSCFLSFKCNGCGNICRDFCYRCNKCENFNFDVKCSFIRPAAIEEGEEAFVVGSWYTSF
jgi:hypothetical protein